MIVSTPPPDLVTDSAPAPCEDPTTASGLDHDSEEPAASGNVGPGDGRMTEPDGDGHNVEDGAVQREPDDPAPRDSEEASVATVEPVPADLVNDGHDEQGLYTVALDPHPTATPTAEPTATPTTLWPEGTRSIPSDKSPGVDTCCPD